MTFFPYDVILGMLIIEDAMIFSYQVVHKPVNIEPSTLSKNL